MEGKNSINKDLILREKLALQRTTLANQSTLLSFLRTSMYFMVAGLSIGSLLKVEHSEIIGIVFFIFAFAIFVLGVLNFFKQKKSIANNKIHVGNYQLEYYED